MFGFIFKLLVCFKTILESMFMSLDAFFSTKLETSRFNFFVCVVF